MNFQDMSDKQIMDIVTPIMDNLMDASTKIDHQRHVQDFSDRMKEIVTKDHLESVCHKYQKEKGYFSRRKLVAVLKRPESAAVIWKQSFTKAKGEFVAEMVLIKKNDKYLVDHTMVF